MKRIILVSGLVSFLIISSVLIPAHGAETVTVTGEIIDTYCFA